MKIKDQDVEKIREYLDSKYSTKYHATILKQEINRLNSNGITDSYEFDNFRRFYDKKHIKDTKLQKILFEICAKNNFNYMEVFEEALKKNSWKSYLYEPYYKSIKKGDYYPKDENTFLEILKTARFETNSAFWAIVALSTVIKSNEIAAKVVDRALEIRGVIPLTLLEIEKLKQNWDKRFKGIDIDTIPEKINNKVNELFSKIDKTNYDNSFELKETHRLSLTIDNDRLSQELKTPVSKVAEQVRLYLVNIEMGISADKEIVEFLTLEKFAINDKNQLKTEVEYVFGDKSKALLNKKVFTDLIKHGMKTTNEKAIQGYLEFRDYNNNDSKVKKLIEKIILDYELNINNENNKTKNKMKI